MFSSGWLTIARIQQKPNFLTFPLSSLPQMYHCSGQFTEYFQRVVVKLKALIAMLDVQTSTRLDNLIYAYVEKLKRK